MGATRNNWPKCIFVKHQIKLPQVNLNLGSGSPICCKKKIIKGTKGIVIVVLKEQFINNNKKLKLKLLHCCKHTFICTEPLYSEYSVWAGSGLTCRLIRSGQESGF